MDRETYDRVTNVLWPFSGLQNVPKEILMAKAEIGTDVHNIIEGILNGLGEPTDMGAATPYVESFKLWWGNGKPIVSTETRLFDDSLRITGKYDLIYKSEDKVRLCDWKISVKESNTWVLQGSAYAHLSELNGLFVDEIEFVKLSKKGDMPKVYHYSKDIQAFLSCLQMYRRFFMKMPTWNELIEDL